MSENQNVLRLPPQDVNQKSVNNSIERDYTTAPSVVQEQNKSVENLRAVYCNVLSNRPPYDDRQLDFDGYSDVVHEVQRSFELGGQQAALKSLKAGIPEISQISVTTAPALQLKKQVDIKEVLNALGRGEIGDAELLAALYQDQLRYDHSEKSWYLWDGHFWKVDGTRQINNLIATKLVAQYLYTAAQLQESDTGERTQSTVEALKKQATSLCNYKKIRNVSILAQSQPALALAGHEWEQNLSLLATQNGVINLKTGHFQSGRPADLIRTAIPVTWQGIEAPAPNWTQFLQVILKEDVEIVNFVQRLFGYALSGMNTEHILPVFWGMGRNGKDTLIETLRTVLGPIAEPSSKDVLMDSRFSSGGSATPHIYALRNLRITWVSETRSGAKLDIEQVKRLTGGGTINARRLHSNPITFVPHFTIFLFTNHKPKADADDYALWQRMLLIPLSLSFVNTPTKKNERSANRNLKQALINETSGILAWMVRGCLEWGQYGLNPPESVRLATESYQQEEDDIGRFIDECCIVSSHEETRAGDLYGAYQKWANSMGLIPVNMTVFGRNLGNRFEKRKSAGVIYSGIGLRSYLL